MGDWGAESMELLDKRNKQLGIALETLARIAVKSCFEGTQEEIGKVVQEALDNIKALESNL